MKKKLIFSRVLILFIIIIGIASPNLVFAVSQNDVISIVQKYANDILVSQERNKLLKIYPSGSYEIKIIRADVLSDKISKIEEQSLWYSSVNINYQLTKLDGINNKPEDGRISIPVYVDDISGNIVPELTKIYSKDVFDCSDKASEICSGVFIALDTDSVTESSWVESSVLEEICVCQKEDKRECGDKPTNSLAYKYEPKPVANWETVKENILNSCQGFSSIKDIKYDHEGEDGSIYFTISPTYVGNAMILWVKRNLVGTQRNVTLGVSKSSGKIIEQRQIVELFDYKDILITKHNAEDQGNYWYIPTSELRNVVKYDWVLKIESNMIMGGEDIKTQGLGDIEFPYKQSNIILYLGIIFVILIFAGVLFKIKKHKSLK